MLALILVAAAARAELPQGMYFAKKAYRPAPLPKFETTRDKLPSPIFDENPVWVKMYWKSWELAFRNFHEPAPESGYVSQFIDAAFNQNIFQWDTCFMTMFCNYAHPLVPGIGSLDNFYCKQCDDGEIPGRSIAPRASFCRVDQCKTKTVLQHLRLEHRQDRRAGRLSRSQRPGAPSYLTLDGLITVFAWAELEHWRVTGDKQRIALSMSRWYTTDALNTYLRQGNGLYMTDWASMDNSPRNPYLDRGGCGIDISSEMALFARDFATMADMLGKKDEPQFRKEADETAALINKLMWDPKRSSTST